MHHVGHIGSSIRVLARGGKVVEGNQGTIINNLFVSIASQPTLQGKVDPPCVSAPWNSGRQTAG